MSSLSLGTKKEINKLIEQVVDKYLEKAENKPIADSGNPFVLALLKDFEPLIHRIHGLKTSLGNQLEKIAEIIATDAWGKNNITHNMKSSVRLPKNVFQEIDSIINNLSNAKNLSNYFNEKENILKACRNPSIEMEEHVYEFDLQLVDSKDNHVYMLEMKGPDPNTTEVPGAKKRLLVSMAWNYMKLETENVDSKLAIYYNNKFPKPYKNPKVHYYFDPNGGILIHDDFWNFLGKNNGTYNELINLFEKYGTKNKTRIWNGFSKLIKAK